jgi:glutamine---fructose-6-phosphate transaminase (isomerizing)
LAIIMDGCFDQKELSMCGIVGGIAQRNVAPILLEGLKRLEYRGYDSAGMAVVDTERQFARVRTLGKVKELESAMCTQSVAGHLGIAHTRWATHGEPSTRNAHPHISGDRVALVHNGIIENHAELRRNQNARGHTFTSETDTEVIVHQVYEHLREGMDLLVAVLATVNELQGAYALGIIDKTDPDRLIATRKGSPLVIGVGTNEHFIASDVFALLPVTQHFIFLEEGDTADIRKDSITIYDRRNNRVERPIQRSTVADDPTDKAGYRHYMLKEIFTQPTAAAKTLAARTRAGRVVEESFGPRSQEILSRVHSVQIVACGTSFHAGMVARYWIESIAGIPCQVEVASEYRYRKHVVAKDTLFVAISQSGETADTLVWHGNPGIWRRLRFATFPKVR